MDLMYCIAFATVLKALPDPRDPRGCRYAWWFLWAVIACGLLSGQPSARAIAQWAAWHEAELRAYLGLDYPRMPSASTIRRALQRVDIECCEAQFGALARQIDEALAAADPPPSPLRGLALDGKELCTASAYGQPWKLLSCARHGSGVTLGQRAIPPHQGEVSVAYTLLAEQDLTRTVVTMDAGFTGRRLLQQILDQGGDYLVVVKPNCQRLYTDIDELFAEDEWLDDMDAYEYTEQGHGRIDTHITTCSADLAGYLRWPGVQQVLRRQRLSQERKTGLTSDQITYGMTSLSSERARAAELERLWRQHWTIENRCHYRRDVTLGEDRCRMHTGNAPQALAALRNILLALLARQGWETVPDSIRFYAASLQQTLHTLGFCRL